MMSPPMSPPMSPAVAALQQAWLNRRREPVLRGVSLDVAAGEHVTLLADDEAATDAVLMLLAGFATPASGAVRLAGRDVAGVPPERRGVAVVHRGLGLFERLTVAGNAGFSGASPRAVQAMLSLAGLQAAAAMRPVALSGAERVRLAIARALLQRSPLLLLNQPLAGLDAEGREAACAFVAAARAEREFAIVHAAADAEAAFNGFGVERERMLALVGGAVAQQGTPGETYDAPATVGVAALTGPLNVLPGTVLEAFDGEVLVGLASGVVVAARAEGPGICAGMACVVGVRPERIALAASAVADFGEGAFTATVRGVAFRRDRWRIRLQLGADDAGPELLVDRPAGVPLGSLRAGAPVAVAWQAHHAMAYPAEGGAWVEGDAWAAAVAPPLARSYPAEAHDVPPLNLQDRSR